MLFGLFKKNPAREARRLNRDARTIVDMARQTYRQSVLTDIARITREGLDQMAQIGAEERERRAREVGHYQALHREAKRQHNQVGLTAYTLLIIHGRSLDVGELAAPARATIREFVDEWPADREQDATLPG